MVMIKTHASLEELYVVSTSELPGTLVRHVKLSFPSWPLQCHVDERVLLLAYQIGYLQHSCWVSPGTASTSARNEDREFLVDPMLPLADCVRGVFLNDGYCHQIFTSREDAERDAMIYKNRA